jgi:hypothetical protein
MSQGYAQARHIKSNPFGRGFMQKYDSRTARLRQLMRAYKLTPPDVARILYRNPVYVKSWHAGINPIPEALLRLLELEIRIGERIERIQMDNGATGG